MTQGTCPVKVLGTFHSSPGRRKNCDVSDLLYIGDNMNYMHGVVIKTNNQKIQVQQDVAAHTCYSGTWGD